MSRDWTFDKISSTLKVHCEATAAKCEQLLEGIQAGAIKCDRLEFRWMVECSPDRLRDIITATGCTELHLGEIDLNDDPDDDVPFDMRLLELDIVRNMRKLVVNDGMGMEDPKFLALHCPHMEFQFTGVSTNGLWKFIEEWKANQRDITFCKLVLEMEYSEDQRDMYEIDREERNWTEERKNGEILHVSSKKLETNLDEDRFEIRISKEPLPEEPEDESQAEEEQELPADRDAYTTNNFSDDPLEDHEHDSGDCEDENCHICIERRYPESDKNSDESDDDSEQESEEDEEESGGDEA